MDDFHMDNWRPSVESSTFGGGLPSTTQMMAQMERRMAKMREEMNSMSLFGGREGRSLLSGDDMGTGFPSLSSDGMLSKGSGGGTGSNIMSSSTSRSSRFSSSTVANGGPPVTKTSTSQLHRAEHTVDGVTTSSSAASHSKEEHSDRQFDTSGANRFGSGSDSNTTLDTGSSKGPGALVSQTSIGAGVMDFLKDAYEIGEDGTVHFKVRFNAKDFRPEDINVTTMANRLTVNANRSHQTEGSSSSREFCRTIDLPRSIDHEKFQCMLTEDGVLILDAPVKAPDYNKITFDSDRNLSIKPRTADSSISQTSQSSSTSSTALTLTGQSGPTILQDGVQGRKLHLEVPVDSAYVADDLCVRMDANRICITGKTKASTSGGNSDISEASGNVALFGDTASSSSSAMMIEFSRSFEIPETVDPFSVTAQLIGHTLVIEAPLRCTV